MKVAYNSEECQIHVVDGDAPYLSEYADGFRVELRAKNADLRVVEASLRELLRVVRSLVDICPPPVAGSVVEPVAESVVKRWLSDYYKQIDPNCPAPVVESVAESEIEPKTESAQLIVPRWLGNSDGELSSLNSPPVY